MRTSALARAPMAPTSARSTRSTAGLGFTTTDSVRDGGIWNSLRMLRMPETTVMTGAMSASAVGTSVPLLDRGYRAIMMLAGAVAAFRQPLPDLLGDEGHERMEQPERRLEDLEQRRLGPGPGRRILSRGTG